MSGRTTHGAGTGTGTESGTRAHRSAGTVLKHYVSDNLVMAGRVLRHTTRSIDTVFTVVLMPILMMLGAVFVLGGAMQTGEERYVDYILPGVLMIGVMSGIAYTAYRLNVDVTRGIFERFHSMPVARASVLGGHVLTSLLFNFISSAAILVVGLLIGFRPQAGVGQWLLAVLVLFLFTMALTWMAAFFGLFSKNAETAGIFVYFLMVLGFVSSGFAPVESMTPALRAFAAGQPMTPILDCLRALLLDKDPGTALPAAILWCAGIWLLFRLLSVWAYIRRRG
ncbi:MAG: ABC transporter permease [Clostridiales Family XIII bacterium]|jgi:ABC-2 type transport system permease protein|nr:ABC transporter permease [Clostridiales Family XIII bacterium]